jgi:hypothetical protein
LVTLTLFKGSAHFPMMDEAAGFQRVLRGFLESAEH